MEIVDFLADWTIGFVRHMDSFSKLIIDIRRDNDIVRVKHKNKEMSYFIRPELDSNFSDILDAAKGLPAAVVTLNTKGNLDKLLKGWSGLSAAPGLRVYFVNPFSEQERKWVICPHVHSKVSDDDALRLGLESLFQTVEPVTEDHIKRMHES